MTDRFTFRTLVSVLFTCAVVGGALLVLRPFLLAIVWAAIIATATWGLVEALDKRFPKRPNTVALIGTTLVAAALVGPMLLLAVLVVNDVTALATFLLHADANGVPVPPWLLRIPLAGQWLHNWWMEYLTSPGKLSGVLHEAITARLTWFQLVAQSLLLDVSARIATLFFALWILFFFYRDGRGIVRHINRIGNGWLGKRWPAYVLLLPGALRAAVNGLVIVGFAEAALLSLLFTICGLPSPVLLAIAVAVVAFIPMAGPLALGVMGSLLFLAGQPASGIVVFVAGTALISIADYVIRPMLIQGGAAMPFPAALFGIFGGIISMGIVGLIVGPVLLILVIVFFREAAMGEPAPSYPNSSFAKNGRQA